MTDMLCVGGPVDGKTIISCARFLEAMEEDGRIAQYEASDSCYRLRGHFVFSIREDGLSRRFIPIESK